MVVRFESRVVTIDVVLVCSLPPGIVCSIAAATKTTSTSSTLSARQSACQLDTIANERVPYLFAALPHPVQLSAGIC